MTRMRRIGLAFGIIVIVSLVAVGVLTGVLQAGVDGALRATGLMSAHSSSGSSRSTGAATTGGATSGASGASRASGAPSVGTTSAAPSTSSSTSAQTVAALTPVLAVATSDAGVDKAALAARIAAVDTKGFKAKLGIAVSDLSSGAVVYDRAGSTGFTPASTNKLLTTTAALSVLGPHHQFRTTVVRGSGIQIILVGGGDPYLSATTVHGTYPAPPSLPQLAAATAAKLKAAGQTKVSLGYDTSLFSGPNWNPQWPELYRDQVSPISSLWVNEGRASPYETGPRVANSPLVAAKAFAGLLKKNGITTVGTIGAARAGAGAPQLAMLKSMPLNLIVERLLMLSDNDAAEVVFRQAALAAGQPGSFVGGQVAVQQTLTKLGLWSSAIRLYDGSGLSRATRVPPDTIVKILSTDAGAGHPELRPVITGLPIAGVAGSLSTRFNAPGTLSARGLARAKTGTLSKVHALAGYVRTSDGSTLVFDVVANDATNDYVAEIYLQRVVTAVATCGCQP